MTKLTSLANGDRKPFRLPTLERHRDALEKCVYCPKLSRASCPVSNATPNETLTPWGKMSTAYFIARGDVPLDEETASPLYACSGCVGCRERCDHKNDVATALFDARAEAFRGDAAPDGARRVALGHEAHDARAAARARSISRSISGGKAGTERKATLLIGCGYHELGSQRGDDEGAIDAVALGTTATLLGVGADEIAVAEGCCGLPLLHAGDEPGFRRSADAFARRLPRDGALVVVDPGCARALVTYYPRIGIEVRAPRLFVDLAASSLDRLRTIETPPPRYHDPCQLGRGLGRFAEPRKILERIAGAPPREFQRHGDVGECSGAGGLLPVTMPRESEAIARARIREHHEAGGGKLVTACASSLRRFQSCGADVDDIVTWVARSLPPSST